MPSLDEVLDYLNSPVDPEKDNRFLSQIQEDRAGGEANIRRALLDSARYDEFARDLGEETFPEQKPALIWRVLDTLDTPRQFVAGNIAKFTGREDYKDLGIIDAGVRGTEENLTTGDMLRETNYFKDRPIQRGVAGFVGDVLTDPLSYLSLFGRAPQIGGLSVSKTTKVPTIAGAETAADVLNRVKDVKLKGLIEGEQKLLGAAEIPEKLQYILQAKAGYQAKQPFAAFNLLRAERAKRLAATAGLDAETIGTVGEELAAKAMSIASELGVNANPENVFDTLELFVKRPSIRISGPLAGSGTLGKLPLVGARDAEIPVVSKASEMLYSALSDGYYGTVATVKKAMSKGLEKNPESLLWNAADYMGEKLMKSNRAIADLLAPLSKRIQSTGQVFGSSAKAASINELARARGLNLQQSIEEANVLFGGLAGQPGSPEMFTKMSNILQSYPVIEAGGMQRIAQELGPEAGEAVQRVRNLFDELAAREMEAGLLGKTIDGYVTQIHAPAPGLADMDSAVWDTLRGKFGPAHAQDFSLQRTFKNLAEAKAGGYRPDENLMNIVITRLNASKAAFAEKEYFERLAYQSSMTPKAYKALLAATMSESAVVRQNALRAISDLDLTNDPHAALTAKYPDVKMTSAGELLTTRNYDEQRAVWQKFQQDPRSFTTDPQAIQSLRAMLKEKEHMGLDFSDVERLKVEAVEKIYGDSLSMIPGRYGESATTRAGARTLSDVMRRELKHLSPEEKEFWNSALPNGLVDTFEESVRGRNLLQQLAGMQRKKQGPGGKLISTPMLRIAEAYQGWTRFLKKTATLPFPAYWSRNMTSAFFQPLESVSALGESLNPFKIYRNHELLSNPARTIISETGEKLTGGQLLAELKAANFTTSATMASEFMNAYADQVEQISEAMKFNVPGLRNIAERELTKKQAGMLRRGVQKAQDFGAAMENWGRQHSYIHLRLSGHDASSASTLANRYMVDYAHGKTEFERNILNNVFFFYSFARGNAANMFMTMARKPGALTTQLHAFQGIGEMLTDPENYNHDPDYEAMIRTTRTDAQLSQYVGTNPITGLPRVLIGAGLPVEDVGRYLQVADVFTRPGKVTWKELMQTTGESAQKSMEVAFSQVNPIAGTMMKLLSGRDFYFDRPITDDTLRRFPKWERDLPRVLHSLTGAWAVPDKVWEVLDDATKTALGGRDNGDGTFTINPYAMAVLVNLSGMGRAINTRKFLTDPGVSNVEKLGRFASGLNVREIDPETTLAFQGAKDRKEYYEARGLPLTKRDFMRQQTLLDEDE